MKTGDLAAREGCEEMISVAREMHAISQACEKVRGLHQQRPVSAEAFFEFQKQVSKLTASPDLCQHICFATPGATEASEGSPRPAAPGCTEHVLAFLRSLQETFALDETVLQARVQMKMAMTMMLHDGWLVLRGA